MTLEIFAPDLGGPVTNGEEVLEVTGVSLNIVDRSMMFTLVETELEVNFDLFTFVSLEDVTLLGTDEVLEWGCIRVIFKTGAAEDLGHGLTINLEVFNELELLCGTGLEVSLIPPEKATIGGCGDAFDTGLTSDPVDIVDWVVMGLLEDGGQGRADGATAVLAISAIEEANATVVGTTDDQVRVLLVEGQGAKWGGWLHADFRGVWIVQVPDVGALGHGGGHLLEAKLGVGGTNTKLTGLWVPCDLGNGTLDGVGVLEDHHSLGGDWLRHELGVLTLEILLEQINLVVLLDAAGGALNKLTSGLTEAHLGLLDELTHVLVDFILLLVVVLLGPTTDRVMHTVVLGGNALSVNLINSYKIMIRMSCYGFEGADTNHGGASLFKLIKKL